MVYLRKELISIPLYKYCENAGMANGPFEARKLA